MHFRVRNHLQFVTWLNPAVEGEPILKMFSWEDRSSGVKWLLTLVLIGLCGGLIGTLLDWGLVTLSYDYVYPPGLCARQGWLWGLVAGSTIAAGLRHSHAFYRISWGRWILCVVISLMCVPLCSAMTAGVAALQVKLNPEVVGPTLVPLARVKFCEGLRFGSMIGSILGCLLFPLLIVRFGREKRMSTGIQAGNP